MAKKRLDILLCERGLADSRQRAQAVIMAGQVYVSGRKVDKAGAPTAEDAQIELRGQPLRYVSRGGLKLEKAMASFRIEWSGLCRYRRFDRRLYRLYAAERGCQGLCCGCRLWAAGLELAQ